MTLLKECRESNAIVRQLAIEQDSIPEQPKCEKQEIVPEIHTSLACEGSTLYLECPAGKTLRILTANYGRTESGVICPSSYLRTTECRASISLALVSGR